MHHVHAPLPGTWVIDAQATLDDLARYATFDEVAIRYANPRTICEAVLGYPVAGGHATKRSIRAVGALLQHRLGPSVAVEALSWAASVAEALDTTSIEMFLEAAVGTDQSLCPLRLEARGPIVAELSAYTTPRNRRQQLAFRWSARRPRERVAQTRWSDDVDNDPVRWLLELLGDGNALGSVHEPFAAVSLIDRFERAFTGTGRIALYEAADRDKQERLASDQRLFDCPEAVLQRCLLDHTGLVLRNAACPPGLVERVRYPYDAATLELAIRAGRRHYHPGRVRTMLADRSSLVVADLARRLPLQLLQALLDTGSVGAADLVHGVLRDIDPTDSAVRYAIDRAVMAGTRRVETEPATDRAIYASPAWLVDLLRDHPAGHRWLWALPLDASPHELRILIDGAADPSVRAGALARLDPRHLRADDAELASSAGGSVAAGCPGIPAMRRPPVAATIQAPQDARFGEAASFVEGRFSYPEAIELLTTTTFAAAPGWRISLPAGSDELARNARLMRNCTAGYISGVAGGDVVILVVHSPEGRRFNVELERRSAAGTWLVGQINSWRNEGDQPEWIRPTLTEWFTHRLWDLPDVHERAEKCLRNRHRRSPHRR